MPDLLSVRDVAEHLDLSPRRVRALVEAGKMRAERVGSRYVISRSDLDRYERAKPPAGRPISGANAWGLLALMIGEDASWLGSSAEWRLRRVLAQGAEGVEDALLRSAPRFDVHKWRLLPGDLARLLQDDDELVLSGLAANYPPVDVPYLPGKDPVEAYVSERHLRELRSRLKPSEDSLHANILLKVPVHPWIFAWERVAPLAVVAADLLEHDEQRVARAGRQVLEHIVDGHRNS